MQLYLCGSSFGQSDVLIATCRYQLEGEKDKTGKDTVMPIR